MNAGKAIFEILTTDTDLVALVGSRIYPEAAPENVQTPFVVYSVQSVEPIRVKNSTSTLDTGNFEVYTSSTDYANAMDINAAIRTAMERRAGNFQGVAIDSIEYIDENVEHDIVSREYVSELRFRLRIARAGTVSANSTVVPLGVNVREQDETTPQFVQTVVFPNSSVDVTNTTASISFSGGSGTANVQMVRANMTATNAVFAATQIAIPFGNIGFQTGSGFSIGTLGVLDVGTNSGTAQICLHAMCSADTNHQLPHFFVFVGSREIMECTGYITGQHGDDHTSVSGCVLYQISASDTISVEAYNDGGTNNIAVDSMTLSVVLLE